MLRFYSLLPDREVISNATRGVLVRIYCLFLGRGNYID